MPQVERGIKRSCSHCGAKFYDLGRTPIICPKCTTPYQPPPPPAGPARHSPSFRRASPVPVPIPLEDEEKVADEDEALPEDVDEDAVEETEEEDGDEMRE